MNLGNPDDTVGVPGNTTPTRASSPARRPLLQTTCSSARGSCSEGLKATERLRPGRGTEHVPRPVLRARRPAQEIRSSHGRSSSTGGPRPDRRPRRGGRRARGPPAGGRHAEAANLPGRGRARHRGRRGHRPQRSTDTGTERLQFHGARGRPAADDQQLRGDRGPGLASRARRRAQGAAERLDERPGHDPNHRAHVRGRVRQPQPDADRRAPRPRGRSPSSSKRARGRATG